MRALAAGTIVLVHVWGFSSPNGDALGADRWIGDALATLSVGVTLFFTLSGFLLYRPFAAAIARGTTHMSIRAYLRNRALRIVPGLLGDPLRLRRRPRQRLSCVTPRRLEVGRLTDPAAFLQAAPAAPRLPPDARS